MNTNAIYFLKPELFELAKSLGAKWDDQKERPVVCLIESKECKGLYWTIPMGNYDHRDEDAKKRLDYYLNLDHRDIRSCFYHIGRTTVKSIFFVSMAIPVTDKYIDREYLGFDNNAYVLSNPNLIHSLQSKLGRILKFEKHKPNYFNQHITDLKNYLIDELNKSDSKESINMKIAL